MEKFTFDRRVPVLPVDDVVERESLLVLIDEHIDNETKFAALLSEHEDDTPEFAAKGGHHLSTRGVELIHAIAAGPASSFAAIVLKGRYLAARRACGDLSYEEAFLFVESFHDETAGGEPVVDPLLEAIEAYQAACNSLNDLEVADDASLEEENALFDAIYGKEKDVLIDAAPTATSLAGVRAAIRLAFEEDAVDDMVAEGALRAALAYLDGRASA
ncbi:hypothetical protein [Shinella sp.]|uniref:hypothetical protein n=1 Tax=Shinella sp. TaxID=1870904 RepID=UPI003F725346